jgi:hypothetical protein
LQSLLQLKDLYFLDANLPRQYWTKFDEWKAGWLVHQNRFWDKSTEHYRYSAFKQILRTNEYLSDRNIDNYIELSELDKDRSMATAALMDLLTWHKLTDEQYTKLIHTPVFTDKIFQNYHRNKSMMKIIDRMTISDEVIEDCIQNYPSEVQEHLLSKEGIYRHQIEYISQHGRNKRIRNMAKNMLRKI